jgi:hypothetical protein
MINGMGEVALLFPLLLLIRDRPQQPLPEMAERSPANG